MLVMPINRLLECARFLTCRKPWLTQYWVRQVAKQTYGDITPERGYGENDEDQGQMAGISALMAMGLFSLDGALPIIRCMILQALFSMRFTNSIGFSVIN